MANIDLSSQFWQVRTELPGVPEPVLHYRYSQAVKDFLHRSEAWRYTITTPVTCTSGEDFPSLTSSIPTNTYVVRPVSVKWVTGTALPFRTRDELDQVNPQWEQETALQPSAWTILQPGVFKLYPTPSATTSAALYFRVALSIKVPDATQIPEELVREWDDAFAAGALTRLYAMPNKDWSNPALAAAYSNKFEHYVNVAKARTASDYGHHARTVQYGGI